jgi:hypothetical protein
MRLTKPRSWGSSIKNSWRKRAKIKRATKRERRVKMAAKKKIIKRCKNQKRMEA